MGRMKGIVLAVLLLLPAFVCRAEAVPAVKEKPGNPAKLCALTFDDGPHKSYTPRILDTLDEYGVKATFFIVGTRIASHADTVRRMAEAGHEIGYHTWHHDSLKDMSASAFEKDFNRWKEALTDAIGHEQPVSILRPPGGSTNKRAQSYAKEAGLSLVIWSLDTMDWKHENPYTNLTRVRNHAEDGCIILMHDVVGASAESLPAMIEWLRGEGYEFFTVSELLSRNGVLPEAGETYWSMAATGEDAA